LIGSENTNSLPLFFRVVNMLSAETNLKFG
jgi:hypothetical protein